MSRVLVALLALCLQGCFYYLDPDPNELRPVTIAPAFTLPAAGAKPPVTLAELRAQGNAVLVFYRGHW